MAGCLSIRLAVCLLSFFAFDKDTSYRSKSLYYTTVIAPFPPFFSFLFFLISPSSRLSLLEEETNRIFCYSMLSHRCTIFFSFVSLISIHIEDGKMIIFNVIYVFLFFSFVLHPFFVRSSLLLFPLSPFVSSRSFPMFPYVSYFCCVCSSLQLRYANRSRYHRGLIVFDATCRGVTEIEENIKMRVAKG